LGILDSEECLEIILQLIWHPCRGAGIFRGAIRGYRAEYGAQPPATNLHPSEPVNNSEHKGSTAVLHHQIAQLLFFNLPFSLILFRSGRFHQ
jgi:hypothetical protein